MSFLVIPSYDHPSAFFYLQSNIATLDEKTGIVTSRRADRHSEEEGPTLCAALDRMKLPSFPQYEVRVRCRFCCYLQFYCLIEHPQNCKIFMRTLCHIKGSRELKIPVTFLSKSLWMSKSIKKKIKFGWPNYLYIVCF